MSSLRPTTIKEVIGIHDPIRNQSRESPKVSSFARTKVIQLMVNGIKFSQRPPSATKCRTVKIVTTCEENVVFSIPEIVTESLSNNEE